VGDSTSVIFSSIGGGTFYDELSLTSANSLVQLSGPYSFLNTSSVAGFGTVLVSSGTVVTQGSFTFVGIVKVVGGTLSCGGGFSLPSSTLVVTATGVVIFGDTTTVDIPSTFIFYIYAIQLSQSGRITVSVGTVHVYTYVIISGGTCNVQSSLVVDQDFSLSTGTLDGRGLVSANGTFTWLNGTQMGTGTTIVYGVLVLSGSTKSLTQRTLVNTHIGYWTSGTCGACIRACRMKVDINLMNPPP
jgi:hypothetical protein